MLTQAGRFAVVGLSQGHNEGNGLAVRFLKMVLNFVAQHQTAEIAIQKLAQVTKVSY